MPAITTVTSTTRAEPLERMALERIYRLRRLRVHEIAFAIGAPLLSVLWLLTEYYEEHTWPSRFASDPDVAGTWDPWLFFVLGIWAIALVVHALRAHFGPPIGPLSRYVHRPVPDEELAREMDHLRSGV